MKKQKLDPRIAKIQKAAANKGNNKSIHISVTVGSRVLCYAEVTPKNNSELLRLKSNRGTTDGLTAISTKLENDEGSVMAQLFVDNKELTFGTQYFGRVINHAVIRINGNFEEKAYTAEGLTAFLAEALA